MALLKYENDDYVYLLRQYDNEIDIIYPEDIYSRYQDNIWILRNITNIEKLKNYEDILGMYYDPYYGFILFYKDEIEVHWRGDDIFRYKFAPHESMYTTGHNSVVDFAYKELYFYDCRTNQIVNIKRSGDIIIHDMVANKYILNYHHNTGIYYISPDNKYCSYNIVNKQVKVHKNVVEDIDGIINVRQKYPEQGILYYIENNVIYKPNETFEHGRIIGNMVYIIDDKYYILQSGTLRELEDYWDVYIENSQPTKSARNL